MSRLERDIQTEKKKLVHFSPDIPNAHEILLPPLSRSRVPVKITSELFRFFSTENALFSTLSVHVRSRFAQIGIHMDPSVGGGISQYSSEMFSTGIQEPVCSVDVFNLSRRAVFLPKGTSFFNMYSRTRKFLASDYLQTLFGSHIRIQGEEGYEWKWFRTKDEKNPQQYIEGIEFFLDPQYVQWVPPSQHPVSLSDASLLNHNRAEVDRYLRPIVAPVSHQVLWIGQTRAHLHLEEPIHAEILRHTDRNGFHINSRILRGGNTGSRIRTEIVSPTKKETRPRSVRMVFLQA
jgi:hypothetical protein